MHDTIIRRKSNALNSSQKFQVYKDQQFIKGNIKSLPEHETDISKFLPMNKRIIIRDQTLQSNTRDNTLVEHQQFEIPTTAQDITLDISKVPDIPEISRNVQELDKIRQYSNSEPPLHKNSATTQQEDEAMDRKSSMDG